MPAWLDNAIFYEIYPQSFLDTNGDGIGDFQGIIKKLDYIKELGCNAIWMNPCFLSPFSDAGYDVSDYCKVAPRYGTNEDLKELFIEAHKRDMRVILDLVPGHTSIEHPWFKASLSPEENEFSHRYIWTDKAWKGFEDVENVRGCIRGLSDRDGSCAANYYTTQPALNYGFYKVTEPWQKAMDSPEALATKEAMKDVMRFWLGMGCDGFRIDMAGAMIKNDEDGKGTIEFWQDFRAFIDEEFPDAAMLSEWGEPDKSLKAGYHMDFLLHFGPTHYMDLFRSENPYFKREGKGDISEFVNTYLENYKKTNGEGLICIPSGNHDMSRIKEKLDDEEVKIAFAFLLSMPGAPFIYYGDEIGMNYLAGIRSVEGGYERTGSRSPMQWDKSTNAGFSSSKPEELYIMIDPDKNRPNVKEQMEDENSLYHEVKKLNEVRLAHEALQSNAPLEFLYVEKDQYPLVYKRTGKEETIVVALNPSDKEVTCKIEAGSQKAVIYSNHGEAVLKDGVLTVPAASASFILI